MKYQDSQQTCQLAISGSGLLAGVARLTPAVVTAASCPPALMVALLPFLPFSSTRLPSVWCLGLRQLLVGFSSTSTDPDSTLTFPHSRALWPHSPHFRQALSKVFRVHAATCGSASRHPSTFRSRSCSGCTVDLSNRFVRYL